MAKQQKRNKIKTITIEHASSWLMFVAHDLESGFSKTFFCDLDQATRTTLNLKRY
jgi:hypothetical protein